ncbi:MAG TPA: DUF475 domain-containing protein [Candidatus Saccharimonadales bacterium]|nr:DUF475 domain-containing protein [Candidatus Saccharimonadales bacterium]
MKELLRIYWFALLATFSIWILVGWQLGLAALLTTIVLTLLETTFSADNAVVNSKVLVTMSPLWQKLFMTVGIFIAVFVVRFALPIFIVMATGGLGFKEVLDLALNHPTEYEHHLKESEPVINAFGGTFLLMIALSYFIDYQKKTHWFGFLERTLGKLGRFDNITVFFMLLASIGIFYTVDPHHHTTVLIASICAMALHIGLELLSAAMGGHEKQLKVKHKVGLAAFASFMYLEILDASFSLDGVIGAFALTNSVIIIMAGLGAGAVWVRAMTIHLVRTNALEKYIFLDHGAHWAIAFLGSVMLLKLYHIELPEWIVGSLGIIFITAAIWWSNRHAKQLAKLSKGTPV